ncbi:branched-chain amino acid ABC transporter permease [Tumebacillus permanentifrigoris]|uniref:Amino acid/amide ABC transporter membrane protein 2 (HAAT family) n=1 Tax=Tumebacillus permanentifrigoris TaxID=378543 RepID=A0A316D6P6_9BACL|nr:branched-chain amino acid ABC transporter permease [Tumebacillus permanentifrigoris]PWK10264.1 amino acid/amide ABC transporter membrane protein 2 (HAAT family) [Tumebacillus permanentifrigoris]
MNKRFFLGVAISLVFYGVIQALITGEVLNDSYVDTLVIMGVNIILAVSLNLINGFTGQFSIGHAGFMSIGAYVSAILTTNEGYSFPLALLCGCLAAAVAGLIIGLPTLRLKGDYLAIATLGFGEIIRIVWLNNDYVGGASGLNGIERVTDWTWTFFLVLITVVVIQNIVKSSHGRALIAIRENEIAAESMGVNVTRYKVIAFVVGAFFAGMAGAISAHYFYGIAPNSFNFMKSFEILVFVVLGGLGSTTGVIVGTILLTLLFTYLQDFPEVRMIIYSLILILTMIFRPKGLLGSVDVSKFFTKKGGASKDGGTTTTP